MPMCKPINSNDDGSRGRLRTSKCLFSRSALVGTQGVQSEELNNGLEVLQEEWFAGNPDMDSKNEVNTVAPCSCGHIIKFAALELGQTPVKLKTTSYPPYLRVSDAESVLVKGSTSQVIMQLLEDNIPIAQIARKLAKKLPTERYSTGEVQSIVRTCTLFGLDGQSPSATRSWETEPIEGWWLKEDSYCEALRRGQPVNEEVCAYNCDSGWWTGRQQAKHRDWERWPCRSIGPENRRRERYRLYSTTCTGLEVFAAGQND